MSGSREGRVSIHLVGRMRVVAPDGSEVAIRSRRGRAILCVLALSPGMARARIILQEMFWPNRSSAPGSLRSELYNLRRDLGPCAGCIGSDLSNVWLVADAVEVDVAGFDPRAWSRDWGTAPPRLVEDLDLDHDFDHWRAEQQSLFEERFDQAVVGAPVRHTDGRPAPSAPVVRIVHPDVGDGGSDRFATMLVSEAVWRTMREHGGLVLTGDAEREADLELSIAVAAGEDRASVVLMLTNVESGVSVWSAGRSFEGGLHRFTGEDEFRRFVNEAAHICARSIARFSRYEGQALTNTLNAIDLMFRSDPETFPEADSLLCESFDIDGDAIHLAWRAYLRTFMAGEGGPSDAAVIREEAEMLSRRALDAGVGNSLVMALVSHVQSFVLGNPAYGHTLAEQAVSSNPGNPLALAYLGRAKCYLGDHEGAFDCTLRASRIVWSAPYRHALDLMVGVTALTSGRLDTAARFGEAALATAPTYRAPMRYLLPLYVRRGDRTNARRIYRRIRSLEPDFSIARLRDVAYPTAAVRQAGLLDLTEADLD